MALRKVSALLLYNSEGKILLQHRSNDAKRLPGYWAFFGGGIEQGETPEQALQREALEELGYKTIHAQHLTTTMFNYKDDENMTYVFVEKYDENQSLQLGEG